MGEMQLLTSRNNSYIKLAASLKQKKFRDESGLFLIEGDRNCREALEAGVVIRYAFASSQGDDELLAHPALCQTPVFLLPEHLLAAIADTKTPQGLILIAEQRFYPLAKLIESRKTVVLLDGLQDPGNVGTILRTAWAAGVGGVIALPNSADLYSPKVVRAAMGALYHLPCVQATPEQTAVALKESGYTLLLADAAGVAFQQLQMDPPIAWLFGSEATGPTPFWRQGQGRPVAIPMAEGVDSLNVAVAAGILLFSPIGKK